MREDLEADFGDLSEFETKLFEQKPWANFEEIKVWKITTAKRPDLNKPKLLLKTWNLILEIQAKLERNTILEKDANGFTQGHTNGLRYWRVGRDADSLDRQKKLEARKMLEKPHRTHKSSARFVGLCVP